MMFLSASAYADVIGGIKVKPHYKSDQAVQKALVSYQKILEESGLTITKEQPCEDTDPEYDVKGVWGACEDLNNAISALELKKNNERLIKLKEDVKKLDAETALLKQERMTFEAENRKLDQDIKALKAIKKASNH